MSQSTFYKGLNSEYFWFSHLYGLHHNYNSAIVSIMKVTLEKICKQMEMAMFQQTIYKSSQ